MLSIFSIKRKVVCGIATVQLNDKERKKMGRGLAKRFISVIITSVMAASLCICIVGCTAINKDEDAENRGVMTLFQIQIMRITVLVIQEWDAMWKKQFWNGSNMARQKYSRWQTGSL